MVVLCCSRLHLKECPFPVGCKGAWGAQAVTALLNCVLSALCGFWKQKRNVLLGLQTFPSSVILNPFPPLFSMNNPKCGTFFLFWFYFPPWLQGGAGNVGDKLSTRGAARGQSHLRHQCPVLLLDSAPSAPSFIYWDTQLWAELLTAFIQVEDACPHHGILQEMRRGQMDTASFKSEGFNRNQSLLGFK